MKTEIIVYVVAVLFVGATGIFLYSQSIDITIGEEMTGETIVKTHPYYGDGTRAHLCHEPACLNDGYYNPIGKMDEDEEIEIIGVVSEHYFRPLPEVVWFQTKFDNHYGWVPRYLTDLKEKMRPLPFKIRAPSLGARLCPVPECLFDQETGRVANNTSLVATEVVYRHYRPTARAKAWLKTRYQGITSWIDISDTDLNIPGPHYTAPQWKSD